MSFFSIIVPVFNGEKTIERTIQSVLNQSYVDFELIIIDDCSNDNTAEIVKKNDDSRIRYFRNTTNRERCVSRNIGIQKSNGRYLCFLDSDDVYHKNHLALMYSRVVNDGFLKAGYFTNALNFNNETESPRSCPKMGENRFDYLLLYTPNPSRFCFERSILVENKFDERFVGVEDLELWLRVSSIYNVYQINSISVSYYVGDLTYTNSTSNRNLRELPKLLRIINDNKYYLSKNVVSEFLAYKYYLCANELNVSQIQKLKVIEYAFKSLYYSRFRYKLRDNLYFIKNSFLR